MIKRLLSNLIYLFNSMSQDKKMIVFLGIFIYILIVLFEPLFLLMPVGYALMKIIYYISDNYLGGYFVNLILWGVGIGIIIYSTRALIDNEFNSFLYVVGGYFLGIVILKFFEN
ncbi:MAG: hypothetical protein ACRCTZ_17355 [Sarcina sp.]